MFKVSEIFPSIQGEGKFSGLPVIFVRFHGCNLNCSYCFGIKPGRRVPRLRLGYKNNNRKGSHKIRLDNIKIGDWIMTYDKNLNLVETEVKNVMTRKVEQWYEVLIDNVKYFITGEHPVFTTKGLKQVNELNKGDIILDVKPNELMSYNAKINNSMFNSKTVVKSTQSTNYDLISEKIKNTIKIKKENGTYISSWNLMSKKQQDFMKEKISKANSGKSNGMYKSEINHKPNYWNLRFMIESGEITQSQLSGKTLKEDNAKIFIVHHIDENPENDDENNLLIVTSREHNQIHERGYNFWLNDRIDGKTLSNLVLANGKEIQNIKYIDITQHKHYNKSYGPKPLNVYNLSCEPFNTYLIDDMYVHNCDTKQNEFTEMEAKDIINKVMEIAKDKEYNTVVFTGGEPFMQLSLELILELAYYFNIHFETNGTYIEAMEEVMNLGINNKIQFIISPKIQNRDSSDDFFKHLLLLETFKIYDNVSFKFLIDNKTDLYYWVSFLRSIPELRQKLIYLQPEFEKRESIINMILNYKFLQVCNYRISTQSHKFLNMR